METVVTILTLWWGSMMIMDVNKEPPEQTQLEYRVEIMKGIGNHKYDFSWITENTETYDE